MTGRNSGVPGLYRLAVALCGLGAAGLVMAGVGQLKGSLTEGLVALALSCLAFGVGEVLNHPKAVIHSLGSDGRPQPPHFARRRNACSLGNLLDIVALLLFFIGISALIFPH